MGCSASKAAPELGKDHPLSPAQSTEAHSGTRSPQSAVSPQKKALTKPDSAAPGFSRPAVVNDVVVVENRVEVDKAAAPPRRALLIDGSPLEKSAAPGKVGSEEGERKEGPEGENIKTGGGEGEEEGEGGRTPVLKSPPLPRAASARAPRTANSLAKSSPSVPSPSGTAATAASTPKKSPRLNVEFGAVPSPAAASTPAPVPAKAPISAASYTGPAVRDALYVLGLTIPLSRWEDAPPPHTQLEETALKDKVLPGYGVEPTAIPSVLALLASPVALDIAKESKLAAETAAAIALRETERRESAEAALRAAQIEGEREEGRRRGEEARVAEERRRSEEAEAVRVAEEKRKAAQVEAARAAEEKRRQQEAARLADERKRAADAEATRLAQEKKRAADAESARLAEEKKRAADAEAARLAEEKKRVADAEAARLAQEKRQQEEAARVADEKRKAAEAEAARVSEEKRKREEEEAAEAARLAEEKRKKELVQFAEEKKRQLEAARAAEEKKKAVEAEAARLAEEKRKAAETARLAEQQRQAAEAEAVRLGEEKRKAAEAEAARAKATSISPTNKASAGSPTSAEERRRKKAAEAEAALRVERRRALEEEREREREREEEERRVREERERVAAARKRVQSKEDEVSGAKASAIIADSEARTSFRGTLTATIRLKHSSHNYGMCVSPDGTVLAVSNYNRRDVSTFALPSGVPMGTFSGSGKSSFTDPCKLCFTSNGNILVAEDDARRVQEVTVTGAHVRFIGAVTIDGEIASVAACSSLIAVGKSGAGRQLFLFDLNTGGFIRAFGEHGSDGPFKLKSCLGLRFTPDETAIAVADYGNHRVSLFSTTGDPLATVGAGALRFPKDVDFAPNGDILVCDSSDRVAVFPTLSSSAASPSSPVWIGGPGVLKSPAALAVSGGALYILDEDSARVQVFN